MAITLANNAETTLAAAINSIVTTMTVADASTFPSLGSGDYFYCTIQSTAGTYEIVKVTAISGNTFTIVRGQESTIAVPFQAGALVELRMTVQNLTDFLLTGSNVNDDAYSAAWDGDVEDAPSRNALYDKIELLLPAASYTAADVLAKILTVDGIGSGLDADSVHGVDGPNIVIRSGGVVSMVNDTDITLGKTTTGSPTGLTIRYNATGGNGFVAWQDDGGVLWKALVTSSDAWQLYNSALGANAISVASATSNVTFAGTVTVPDDAYAAGWNGDLTVPTKNAVYDQMESRALLTTNTFSGLQTFQSDISLTTGTDQYIYYDTALHIAQNGVGDAIAIDSSRITSFATTIKPTTNDVGSLGTSAASWSDLFLASGAVINFNNGDVTLTHSSNALTGSGGQFLWTYGAAATTPPARFTNTTNAGNNTALIIETDRATPTAYDAAWIDWYASNNAGTQVYAGAYGIALSDITAGSVDGVHYWRLAVNSVTTDKMYLTTSGLAPYTNDGLTLGFGTSAWSDLFLASGGVINFNNGDVTITHSTDLLAGTGGQLVWSQATAAAAIKTINNLDAATMQLLRLDHDRATPTAGDLGYISFYSSDSAGNQDEFGRIAVEASSVTSTSEIGELRFYGITSGSLVHRANINASTFRPGSNDGLALGTATVSFSDLFLASGAVIGFNNGDVTLTHSSNTLTFGGASSGYIFDAVVRPSTNDGAALGSATVSFSDVFLADGAVINYANGSATITHNVADDSITVSNGGLQTPTRVSTETGGTLTSASRNCIVRCATAPTLPASGMSDGDFIIIDPRGTARTVTRPAAHTMYKNDVDSATVTTYAHNVLTAVYHGSSKWTVSGAA